MQHLLNNFGGSKPEWALVTERSYLYRGDRNDGDTAEGVEATVPEALSQFLLD